MFGSPHLCRTVADSGMPSDVVEPRRDSGSRMEDGRLHERLAALVGGAWGLGASPLGAPGRVAGNVVELALEQRVGGLLLAAARRELGPADVDLLQAAMRAHTAGHLTKLVALARAGCRLKSAGVPWVVVKGPVLVELAYAGVPRSYQDLDLLVAPHAFKTAVATLEDSGATLLDRNWDMIRREDRAELHLLDPTDGTAFDVHWHLVNIGRMRRGTLIATDELLERRRLAPSVGTPVLDPTDRLIHYAFHGTISGGHQLVWMADVAAAVVHDPPDWEALIARSRQQGISTPVAVLLARSQHVLGAPIPDGLLAALVGQRWQRRAVHWLKAWRPSGRLPGGGSLSGAVTRSLVDLLPATAANTAVLASEMLRRVIDPYPHWTDPEDPAHVLNDLGGSGGRKRYFDTVTAHDRFGHLRT